MKHYVLHDANGVIRSSTSVTDESPAPQLPGLTALQTAAPVDPRAWHVAGGALVAGLQDLRTLAQRKADKWTAIKAERESRASAPVSTPFGTFDCDPASQAKLTSVAVMLMNAPGDNPSTKFTLADNSRPTFTRGQLVAAALMVGQAVQALYDTADTLRQQIDAATTAAEVDAVTWPA